MNLYYSKLCVFVLLVVCRLLCGLSPLFISRKIKKKFCIDGIGKRWMEKGVSYSMDFSGGILLATSFIHMLPEVRDNLQSIMGSRYTFPYAETLVCVGLFTVYVIEEIVRHIVEDKSWHHRHHHNEKTDVLIAVKDADPQFVDVKLNNGREAVDGGDSTNHIQLVSTNNKTTLVSEMNIMVKEEANECNNNTKNKNSVSLKHILLVSALSFHSVMEGIALGLAESLQDLWYLFLAVMAHECTILLCVGIDMVATCSCTSAIIKYMAVLAVVSPTVGGVVGTMISFLASENGSASGWMTAVYIMQGLAAGTILYVTFFEVLNNHKHHHHQVGHRTSHNHQHSESGLPKLAFIAMGFAFMILLEMTSGHDNHGHGHNPHHNVTFLTNNSSHTHL